MKREKLLNEIERLSLHLSSFIEYNPEDGNLYWKIYTHGFHGQIFPGDVAGTTKDGYVLINIRGKVYRAHRVAWLFMTGDFPPTGKEIDHINGNRSDNRWSNLRLVTRSQNNMNKVAPPKNNSSGVTGVARDPRGGWQAYIQYKGKQHGLGRFEHFENAVAARRKAEVEFFGEHGVSRREVLLVNVPKEDTMPVNERRRISCKQAWTPELRKQHSKKLSAYLATPEGREQRSRTSYEVSNRPDVKAKNAAAISALIWITDGSANRRINKDTVVPVGWRRGRCKVNT